ncbi:21905_t:CDS:2 [Cetraspora pellucida]|uniref:21905_t:CDS:1 n=1 Tax=Cetraspora pellucida TaxID=1433469 RepID=A0A9N9AMH5_9GLOM|nr:21905_t:CDS:2 [Cetraspora pellucida]
MEQPSINVTATQSVDYLGHTHDWSETDIIYSYKEVCRQLDACRKKCGEEQQQLQKNSRPSVGLQQQRTSGKPILGNISKQLQQQKHESALRAEEKRLIRMKNALWRRMGPSVGCVGKGNKLVSPKTLKWQKECDILWLFGPLYQPDNDPFMEEDDDETLVGSPPGTCCPPSPIFGATSSPPLPFDLSSSPSSSPSIYIKPALKKPVEHDPLKDLISYAYEMMLINAKNPDFNPQPIEPKQKKKTIRFSRNLEQVHYTPTHYSTVRPSTPPMRRRVNSPFSLKMENDMFRDQGINKHHGNYDQMFAWAKEQVKSTGKVNLPFGKDGSFVGGPYPNDDDFILPPPMIRPTPRGIPRGSPPRRMMVPPPNYPHHPHHNATKPRMIPRSGIEVKRMSNQQMRVPEMNESGVVEKCVNIASNVKDVVSWCGKGNLSTIPLPEHSYHHYYSLNIFYAMGTVL